MALLKKQGATCTTAGYTSHKCTVPGCNYEEYEWIEPLGHEWSKKGTVTQEQSCENPEITTYKCERTDIWPACKATKQVETKPALGHTWDEGKVTKKLPVPKQELRLIPVLAVVEQKPKRSQKQNITMKSMSKLRQPVHPEASVTMYVKTADLQHQKQTPATGHIHTEVRNKRMQLIQTMVIPEILTVKIVVRNWKQEP